MRTPELLSLRKGDKRILQERLRIEKDAKMWQRYNCIFLCVKKPRIEVGKDIGMSYRNMQRLVSAYKKHGVDSLRYKILSGRPSRLSGRKQRRIISIIESNPQGWETKKIREIIQKKGGVLYTKRHIYRIAQKRGFAEVTPRTKGRRQNVEEVRLFKKD